MFCEKCGSETKVDQARFCWNCGASLPVDGAADSAGQQESCLVVCTELREKWSFFGKDVNVFRAVPENSESDDTIAKSKEFIVTGFSYEGPSKVNRCHLEAFNDLVDKLEKKGWRQEQQYGEHWYSFRFVKP